MTRLKPKRVSKPDAMRRWGLDLAFLSMILFASCSHAQTPEENPSLKNSQMTLEEIALKKRHHGAERFINPFAPPRTHGLKEFLKWKLFFENPFREQYADEPVNPVKIDWKPIIAHEGLSVTFINHASVLIRDAGVSILVDPVFFGLFPTIKNFTPIEFEIDTMPKPDHVLITHGHYDHLDKTSLGSLDKETHLITPLGYNDVFDDLGMNRRTQMDWFDIFEEGERKITLLPCNHWTMRNPLIGPNRSLWGSFLFKTKSGATIYISGDTGYFEGFKEIGEEFSIDLAIFNLSAYEPRWFMSAGHINPRETVRAFRELQARHLFIVHWGTFRLGDEPVYFPPVQLKQELAKEGLSDRLLELDHGETLTYERERCVA